jgi:hypothetical protein
VTPEAPADNARFGCSVAAGTDTVIIGSLGDNTSGAFSGTAYVFTFSGMTWSRQQILTASDAASYDKFGTAVALSGDTALIGAEGDDEGGNHSGSAYVFIRSGSTWTQQAKLTAADAQALDSFGMSVALSGDTALIGAYFEDEGGQDAGAAYVFTRSGSSWTQQAKLLASDAAEQDQFGYSVTLEGDTALIGAPGDDDAGPQSGSVYVFTRSETAWTQQAKLAASGTSAGDLFGCSLSLDNNLAVIGASMADTPLADSGAVYAFIRSGSNWEEKKKCLASNPAQEDEFGSSVCVDSGRLLTGAPMKDDARTSCGAAYIQELLLPQAAPDNSALVLSATDSLTFSWRDNSLDETGFNIFTASGHTTPLVAMDTAVAGATSYLFSGLTPNAPYSFRLSAFNPVDESTPTSTLRVHTQAASPSIGNNVICDKNTSQWYSAGTLFTFSNPAGFGPGTHGGGMHQVSAYNYVWDSNASYIFSGTESVWTSGSVQFTPALSGSYYLHLQSMNEEGNPGAGLDYGPFQMDTSLPVQLWRQY